MLSAIQYETVKVNTRKGFSAGKSYLTPGELEFIPGVLYCNPIYQRSYLMYRHKWRDWIRFTQTIVIRTRLSKDISDRTGTWLVLPPVLRARAGPLPTAKVPLEELGPSLEKLREQYDQQLRTLQEALKAAGTKERENLLQAHSHQLSRLLRDITEKVHSRYILHCVDIRCRLADAFFPKRLTVD